MLFVLRAAWPVVARRGRAQWLLVGAAGLVVLGATTLLAAAAMYGEAVAEAGLRRALLDAPRSSVAIRVSSRVAPVELPELQATIDVSLEEALWPIPGDPARTLRAEAFAMPRRRSGGLTDLAALVGSSDVARRADLVDGRWPEGSPAGSAIETALWAPAAETLGLGLGDRVQLVSRAADDHSVDLIVVGLYLPRATDDPYWASQPLQSEGSIQGSFRTWGPFFVTEADLLERVATGRIGATWVSEPSVERLEVERLAELRSRATAIDGRLRGRLGERHFTLDTQLPELLAEIDRSLLASRSGVLLVTAQLALLAGYALTLVAALLVDVRRLEAALLAARGAGTVQLAAMSLMEALLLVVPAALLGPLLADRLLRAFDAMGPLAQGRLSLEPDVGWTVAAVSGVAAVGCLAALVAPTLVSGRTLVAARRARGRQGRHSLAQRLGLDLALAAVAIVALWQLRHYGAPLTRTVRGALGIDPLLVAAPAVGLLAGAVVALRLVPLAAEVSERLLARRAGLVGSLGARQLARRPLRYTRSALLLMLATALGVFASGYGATWLQSQRDQADYQVGGDVRFDAPTHSRLPAWSVPGRVLAMPGVRAATPVVREGFDVGRERGAGELLALDPDTASRVVRFRADLADRELRELLGQLRADRAELPLVEVPDDVARLALVVDASLRAAAPDEPQASAGFRGLRLSAVLRDGTGAVHEVTAGRLPIDGGLQRAVIALDEDAPSGGDRLAPAPPVELVAVNARVQLPPGTLGSGTLRFHAAEWAPASDREGWRELQLPLGDGGWTASAGDTYNAPTPLGRDDLLIAPSDGDVLLGNTGYETVFSVAPAALAELAERPMPILVNERFMADTATRVGDELEIGSLGLRRRVVLAGTLRGFPTVHPAGSLAVADVGTLSLGDLAREGRLPFTDEWWLAVDDGAANETAAALADPPFDADAAVTRVGQVRALTTDPVALGLIGALALGTLAAVLFSAVGFVLSAAVSARERLTEFALLRALGLSPVQLSGWLSLESGFLLLLGMGAGVGLGLALAWVVLPSVTLTPAGTEVVPSPVVVVPWQVMAALAGVAIAAFASAVAVLGGMLRRLALAGTLRRAED